MLNRLRPIRLSGWAFPLSASLPTVFGGQHPRLLWAVLFLLLPFSWMPVIAQTQSGGHQSFHDTSPHNEPQIPGFVLWEGSPAGVAYSKFNHHVAGVLMLIIGVSEMIQAIRIVCPAWMRLLLPGALGVLGLFLMVWSDHEAWPIGHLSVEETFLGHDYEVMQHKLYGILALTVSVIEGGGRFRWIRQPSWAISLPLFAIVGGLMLFAHSHGYHPGAEKIALHHALMGTMAVTAGFAKGMSIWQAHSDGAAAWRWEALWAGLLLLVGTQLMFYTE